MKPNFTNEEWNRIVEDAFSKDAPEPPFSPAYRAKRLELERMVTMKEQKHTTFQPGLAIATAAALMVAAVPVGLIWHLQQNKVPTQPESSLTPASVVSETEVAESMAVDTTEESSEAEGPAAEPRDESPMMIEFGYLPEGMYLHEENDAYGGKIHDDPAIRTDRGITPEFVRLPSDMAFAQFTEEMLYEEGNRMLDATVENSEHEMWIHHNGQGWDEVWMHFYGTPYVLHLFYNNVTDEDIRKVLDDVKLVPTDTETIALYVPQGKRTIEPDFLYDTYPESIEEIDPMWVGKILQAEELVGIPRVGFGEGRVVRIPDEFPMLAIEYQQPEKYVNLCYTTAPADLLPENVDLEVQEDVLDFGEYRVRLNTWGCTDAEISEIRSAVEAAAEQDGAEAAAEEATAEDADTAANETDYPSFWNRCGVNSHGETYAGAGSVHMDRSTYDQLPDLIEFGGPSGTAYAKKTELFDVLGDDPDAAMCEWRQDFEKADGDVLAASLNLYDKEGETIITVVNFYKAP